MSASSIPTPPTLLTPPNDSSKLIYHTRHNSSTAAQTFITSTINDIVNLIEHYYTSSNQPIQIIYINATIPQQLNSTITNLKQSSHHPSWLKNDDMMKNFQYIRISDLTELQRVVETSSVDILVVENLLLIIRNTSNNYTLVNAQVVKLIKLMKAKVRLKLVIIDVEHNWFIELLV